MADIVAIRYRAFLSYSHHDRAWAKWLHAALESYRIDRDLVGRDTALGPVPSTLRPIFCDRDDFSAGHSLSDQTLAALAASRCLVVIGSPHAVASKYVNAEIRQFKALGGGQRIIPIIVDGEPNHPERECFPPALRFKAGSDGALTDIPEEPIAADARWKGDGKELALRKVVAGLLGLGLDEVVRRAEIDRRHRNKVWLSFAAAVVLLFLVAAVASPMAYLGWVGKEQSEDKQLKAVNDDTKEIEIEKLRGEAKIETLLAKLSSREQRITQNGLDTPKGQSVKAQIFIVLASAYQTLGNSEKSLELAKNASEILNGLIASEASEPRWRRFLRVYYEKLTGVVQPSGLDLQNQLSIAYQKIGDSLFYRDRLAVARDWYDQSLQKALLVHNAEPSRVDWRSGLSRAYDKIGDVSKQLGYLADARTSYEKSLAIRANLAEGDPDNAQVKRDLASVYDRIADILRLEGKLVQALETEERSRSIVADFLATDANNDWRRNLALDDRKLADIHHDMGQLSVAFNSYRESLDITKQLNTQDPKNTVWRRDLAASYVGIGGLLGDQGQLGEAERNFRLGIDILEDLARSDPTNTEWQDDLALVYDRVAAMLGTQARIEALQYYQRSLAIRQSLADKDPENLTWQYKLGASHANLAFLLNDLDARNELELAKQTFQRVSTQEPGVPFFKHDLAAAIICIGNLLSFQQQFAQAHASYREGLSIMQDLPRDNIGWQYDLALAYGRLAQADQNLGNVADALAALQKGRDIVLETSSRFCAAIQGVEPVRCRDCCHRGQGARQGGQLNRSPAVGHLWVHLRRHR